MSPTDSLSSSHVKVVYNDTSFVMTSDLPDADVICRLVAAAIIT